MRVLSLFDGMACGHIAFKNLGIPVDAYYAYEIDKYAIKTALHNFNDISENGDVFAEDFTKYEGNIDWLIGGSPCTYWSIAQTKNREIVASGIGWELFSQYVRALHGAKPKFFLYENNKSMSAAIKASITDAFGFDPILINSALVSAQNRQRLYWVGIRQDDGTYRKANIEQPEDMGILLKDILETNRVTWLGKAHTIDATYYKATDGTAPFSGHQSSSRMMVAEPVSGPACLRYERTEEGKRLRQAYESGEIKFGYKEHKELQPREDGKTNTLSTVQSDNMVAEPVDICCAENPSIAEVLNINPSGHGINGAVIHCDGKSRTLTTNKGEGPKIIEPVCVNSKSGRGGVDGLQPSLQDRIYYVGGEMPAVTTSFNPNIAEPLNITCDGKAQCLRATYYKDGIRNLVANDVDKKTCVAEKVCKKNANDLKIYEVRDGQIEIKGKKYPIKLVDGFYIIRKLTVTECMRLQTVPEWYEWPVSNSQAYKMLGNGWTVEVIMHLINSAMEDA